MELFFFLEISWLIEKVWLVLIFLAMWHNVFKSMKETWLFYYDSGRTHGAFRFADFPFLFVNGPQVLCGCNRVIPLEQHLIWPIGRPVSVLSKFLQFSVPHEGHSSSQQAVRTSPDALVTTPEIPPYSSHESSLVDSLIKMIKTTAAKRETL